MSKTKRLSFVNIIFFVIFGVLTGVLWAFASPIPVVPGAIFVRTFAFIAPVIGILFGPVTGFFAGYIGTIVWGLIVQAFIPLHSPFADGICVGLSAALPALCLLRGRSLDELLKNKTRFIIECLAWTLLFGVLMVLGTSFSLIQFLKQDYIVTILQIGAADLPFLLVTPFAVLLLAPRLKKLQTAVPRI